MRASGTEVVTVSLRREGAAERSGQGFWSLIRELGVRVLPNTAGCHSVKEAVTTAHMAREVFGTPWIKLEVIGEDDTLQPDVFGLVEAAAILSAEGFEVFPYTTEDLVVAERLLGAGCRVLMPWGSPIGSGRGLNNLLGLKALRAHFPVRAAHRRRRHRRALACRLRRWSWDSTRSSSTPQSPRHAIRCRWRTRSRQAVAAGHLAFLAGAIEAREGAVALHSGDRHGVPRMMLPRVYPIIDSAAWVPRLAPAGVRLLQLRIKNQPPAHVARTNRGRAGVQCRGRHPAGGE